MRRQVFVADEMTRSAVLNKVAVMGKRQTFLPDDVRAQYPGIPGCSIAGLRDKVIHKKIGGDFELPGETVDKKIPLVIAGLHTIPDDKSRLTADTGIKNKKPEVHHYCFWYFTPS